jgi:hypothetical protein
MNINLNDLVAYCQKIKNKYLTVRLILDNRICNKYFSETVCKNAISHNKLGILKNHFPTSSKLEQCYSNGKVITDKKFIKKKITSVNIIDKPIICEFYTIVKVEPFKYTHSIYRSIFTLRDRPWVIRLILEKDSNVRVIPDWNNNDRVFIEFSLISDTRHILHTNIQLLKKYINAFSEKHGGNNDIKTYVVENISKLTNKNFKYINKLFIESQLINKTDYYNIILMNVDEYQICNITKGVEYIIYIDSFKSKIYYISSNHIEDDSFYENVGITVLSAVKYNGKFFIRRVIVENSNYLSESSNKCNIKYGKILNMPCCSYMDLNEKTYIKTITDMCKNLKKGEVVEFTKKNKSFYDSIIYQWSVSVLSITFLCRKCPDKHLVKYPKKKNENLYLLYLTCNQRDFNNLGLQHLDETKELFYNQLQNYYFPLHFSSSTNPDSFLFWSANDDLDNKYIELIWNTKWIFLSSGAKTLNYGDDFKYTELNTWNYYRNPVLFKNLTIHLKEVKEQMYFPFSKHKKMYEPTVKYNSFVKGLLIGNKKSDIVIDMASGKGQDLFRYYQSNIRRILMMEIDKDAIDVLLERKYIIENRNKMKVNVLNTDLNDNAKTNIEKVKKYHITKVDQIYCFFALHYLLETPAKIKNIVTFISSLLQKNGEFLYTSFDKIKVSQLLEKTGKWDIYEEKVHKYSIIKTNNNIIKLFLPLNPEQYYSENLIDDVALDNEFKKCKMRVCKEGNFLDHINEFNKKNPHLYQKIKPHDKIFISLYKYKIYKKN